MQSWEKYTFGQKTCPSHSQIIEKSLIFFFNVLYKKFSFFIHVLWPVESKYGTYFHRPIPESRIIEGFLFRPTEIDQILINTTGQNTWINP